MAAHKGNRYNEKYTKEQAIELFIKAVEYAKENDDCLSVQDAVNHIDIPHSTFYHLCESHEELDNIKKDINNQVIARINRQALKNKFNATASIWRMKQLGEKDKQEIESNNYNQNMNVSVSEEDTNRILEEFKKKY